MEEEAKKGLGAVGKGAEAIRKIVAILEELRVKEDFNNIHLISILKSVGYLYIGQSLDDCADYEAVVRLMR